MKHLLKSTLSALIIFTLSAVPALAQANETAKKRAEELLASARAAIGGDAKIRAVKTLSLTGKYERSPSAVLINNDAEFDFLFPDKYIKRERINTPLGVAVTVAALDGEITWYKFTSPNENVKIKDFSQKEAEEKKPALRADAARWILGLLLRAPNWSPLEFIYAGEADADGKQVNLINVKGTDGFEARLFLDKTTHRLTMLKYTGKLANSKRKPTAKDGTSSTSKGENSASGDSADMKAEEVIVHFADYRAVEGIQIPHRAVYQSSEGTNEEWELTSVKLNAPLAPEIFKKKG